jgi:hypothetical protein
VTKAAWRSRPAAAAVLTRGEPYQAGNIGAAAPEAA